MENSIPFPSEQEWEDHIIGKTKEELIALIGKSPVLENENECVFILSTYFMGILKKRLYIFLDNDIIHDYFIGI